MNAHDHGLDILGMQIFVKGPPLRPRANVVGHGGRGRGRGQSVDLLGARTKQTARHMLGAIDVDGLTARLDNMPDKTNRTVWELWSQPEPGFPYGHGMALSVRADQAAQNILNSAVLPTNEFAVHDAVITFAKRASELDIKISKLPYDDAPSPLWADVRAYFIDGSQLVNKVEGVADKSVKWGDVKDDIAKLATGAADAAKGIQSTVKWTYWITIGAAVGLIGALGFGAYKFLSGPYAPKLAQRYLP